MTNPTSVFDLINDSPNEMLLYLEPEGLEFPLPPGKVMQVKIFGIDRPFEMKHSNEKNGQKTISFWPINGTFELFFEGKNILERT
jgi:hypothetical protein